MGWKSVQVAIVGAGPVGLSLASLLKRSGVSVAVFERRASLHGQPQAHVINTRTMEVFRDLGIDRRVASAAAPMTKMRFVTWCESLAGREFGRLSLLGADPASAINRLSLSPTVIVNLAQNKLEPILLERFVELGGEVAFRHEVQSVREVEGGVEVDVRTPEGDLASVTADYVVACDGAGSGVRRSLGIEMFGPASLQTFVSVYFTANLDRYLAGRLGPLQWIMGPDVRGVIIGFDIATTWALMCPYMEPTRPEEFTPDVALSMVRKAIGDPDADVRIDAVGSWNMSAQVAARYREGRIFLAGDAAHRFPPSGGLGLNTGVQDAHNLSWKLTSVLNGMASGGLLDTYEEERRPVAITNCEHSVGNSKKLAEVDTAVGASSLAPVTPATCAGPPTPYPDLGLEGHAPEAVDKRAAIAEAIAGQIEHFDFAGIDFGVRYEAGALCSDGSAAIPFSARHYEPDTRPGSRLPHVWVSDGGRRLSTHDLTSPSGFVLITGGDGSRWASAAKQVADESGFPISVVAIGEDGKYQERSGAWVKAGGPVGDAALLVRPDHHIAWRTGSLDGDGTRQLRDAVVSTIKAPAAIMMRRHA